jgi:hypothetical protein
MANLLRVEYQSIAEQQKLAAEECELGLVRDLLLSSAARFAALADATSRCEPPTGTSGTERPLFY